MTDRKKNGPFEVLRDGALKATIWKNEGENGAFFSTTLSKTFEQNGSLQDGQNFTRNDLLRVSELARQAYAKIGKTLVDLKQENLDSEVEELGEANPELAAQPS